MAKDRLVVEYHAGSRAYGIQWNLFLKVMMPLVQRSGVKAP